MVDPKAQIGYSLMRTVDASKAVMRSETAFNLVYHRFIAPFEPLIGVGGVDGVTQEWNDEEDRLVRFLFPRGYAATSPGTDVGATEHEMGHFITVSEDRAVRAGFGFGGGMPELGFSPDHRMPLSPASADVEAKAIAWEYILRRDLHGVEPDLYEMCASLKYATDFPLYEGKTDAERVTWVSGKVQGYVDAFGSVEDFERLWVARCQRLPELFRRENIRLNLYKTDPVNIERFPGVVDGWSAELATFMRDGVSETTVTITADDDEMKMTCESFLSEKAARNWVERVRSYYADPEMTQCPV